ncbi:restriction endonuclease subunit S [Listeria monocytogenes]|uniref:restriction endonuclease subunit S n=1 Tax=Listeria monocytogenes TaxID=1639 RepID=UPI00087497D5|nr:restriction endonuclease subunit S [Listeria monocytogenes]EAD6488635.1 restriction endonuclease subunit S [Listeria monocytogenes]EKZ1086882.1 restriction endonuclease subunit S [Listeria monocytogenes]EKZ1089745.1 restriction endonuclease subunit S [Listeria monocytogenes]EKZ1096084.1 restriction endonuclease subunit S [Listeria monocytogenes]OFG52376.1 restriction endonuclease subunit S [Listeria monocytogenes]
MKKLEKSVPVIRFKGFSEAWEQRKLGELGEVTTGKAFSSTSFDNQGEYLVITNKNISDSSRSQNIITNRISISDDEIIQRYRLDGENILVTMDGVNLGKTAMYSNANALLAQRVGRIKSNQLEFIYQITSSNTFLRTMQTLSVGNAIKHISLKQISEYSSLGPKDIIERKKIGSFFKKLDNAIALHQRKLDALKLLKKGFLQQMVTKSGENIPKIRFDDFDDIWEQRILGEFLKESKIKGSNGSLAKKLTVKLWRKGVVPKEEIYTGSSATQYYIRKTGQFMYGKLDFLNQAFGIVPLELNGYESTLDSPAFDIEDSLNETFLLEYVSLARFYKYQGNIANGSRRAKRIHTDTFFEMPIPLPNSNEQQKIGTFSQQIDDLITLQQNKLEKLSSLKRFYLKNMFI